MKTTYLEQPDPNNPFFNAIADLTPGDDVFGEGTLVLTRIETRAQARGNRLASKLLARICEEADQEGVELWLEVVPDGSPGGLTKKQLTAWYSRYGFLPSFRHGGWFMCRVPHRPQRRRRPHTPRVIKGVS